MAKITLQSWIKRCLNDADKGKCTQFSLVHMLNGGSLKGKELDTAKLGNGRNWTEKDLAERFQGVADSYGQDLSGTQTFQVMAFYEGNEQPQSFFHITNQVADDDGNMSFAPNAQGRAAQSMSQESKVFAQVYNKQSQLDSVAMGIINFIGEDNISLRKENRELQSIFFDFMKARLNENREHELKVMTYQRATEERKGLMRMAPALVNSITGKDVFPTATEDTAIIETLAETLPIEAVQQMAAMLGPQLGGVVLARFEKHAKAKLQAELDARSAVAPLEGQDPEDELSSSKSNIRKIK